MESLRGFMVDHVSVGVTNEQFVDIGSIWLTPVGLPAAVWVERVPASERAKYERRVGHGIVTTRSGRIAPSRPRPAYMPTTLVTRISPFTVPGIDLGAEPSLAEAVARPRTRPDVTATPLGEATRWDARAPLRPAR